MKKMYKGQTLWAAALMLCFTALLTTCKNSVGLGGSIDINPPTVDAKSIYPPMGAVIKDSFILSVEAEDDTEVVSIAVTITPDTDAVNPGQKIASNTEEGFFYLKKTADGKRWEAELNKKNAAQGYPIKDGAYQAEFLVQDRDGKKARTVSSFTIDNTAPLLILNRPSTAIAQNEDIKNSTPDTFGDGFLLVGQVYDETQVAVLTVTAHTPGESTAAFKKDIRNVPQNIRITVDAFSSDTKQEFYQALYGTNRDAGSKKYEYGITVTDDAKLYQSPGDKGTGSGNMTDRYYLFDELYSEVLSEYRIQTVYAMMRGSYRSQPATGTTRSSAEIEADTKKIEAVQQALQKAQVGGEGERKGTFALNPSLNPLFDIAGEKPVAKPESGTPAFSPLYSGSTLTVKMSCNLDGIPLAEADSFRFFLMKWADFSAFAGNLSYPTAQINGDDIYADAATQTLKPAFIEITKSNFQKEGSNYIFSVPVPAEPARIPYGESYVLLVRGKDVGGKNQRPNELIPDTKGVTGGVYGFVLAKTGKAPEVFVTQINETAGTGTDSNITERVYLKKGDSLKFKMKLQPVAAKITYTLQGAVGGDVSETKPYTVDSTTKVGEHEVTIDKAKFNQDADGTYKLTVKAEADEGKSLEQTYTIVYDVKKPEAEITTLVEKSVISESNGTAFSVSGTAFDTGIGLASVTVKLSKTDGTNTFTDKDLTVTLNGGGWTTETINLGDAAHYGEGKYTLKVTATDKLGLSKEDSRSFFYDKKAPAITDLKVDGKTVVNGGTVYTNTTPVVVSGNLEETYGTETFTIKDESNGLPSQTNVFNKSLTLTEGQHNIAIVLKDKAGQSAPEFKFNVVADTTAPVFETSSSAGQIRFAGQSASGVTGASAILTSDNPVKITGLIQDPVHAGTASGIKEVKYAVTGSTEPAPSSVSTDWKQLNGTLSAHDYTLEGFVEKLPVSVEKKIHIRAVDNAGNEAVFAHTVKVVPSALVQWVLNLKNGTLPTDTVKPNAGDWYAKNQFKVEIGGTLSSAPPSGALMTVEITKKGSPNTTVLATDFFDNWTGHEPKIYPNDQPSEYTVKSGLADGTYTIKISTADGQAKEVTFTVDGTDPSITPAISGNGVLPAHDSWVSTKTLSVAGTATDATSGIEKIEAIVNSGTPKMLSTESPWSGYLTLAEGNNTVQLRVTDKAGNTVETAARTIKVDTQPPHPLEIVDVDGKGKISSLTVSGTTAIKIKGTIADAAPSSDIKDVQWKLEPISGTATPGTATLTSNTWEISIPKDDLKDGSVIITATDNAGNKSDSVRVNIRKDTTGPMITVIAPSGGYISTKKPKFEASIIDSNGIKANTAKLHYKKDSETSETTESLTESSGSYSFTPSSALTGKIYEFWFSAEDELGNPTSSAHTTVTIDTDNPKLEEVKVKIDTQPPSSDATVYSNTGTVTVSGKATDANGIDKVEILEGDSVKKGTSSIGADHAWSIGFTGTELPDGTHNLTIRATDKAGKIAEVQRTVVVDKNNPALFVTNIGTAAITGNNFTDFSNGYIAEGGLLIKGTAADSEAGSSGVDFVHYIFHDGTNNIGSERSLTLDTAGHFDQTIQVPATAKKLTLTCADRAGNKDEITIPLKVDSKIPKKPEITDIGGKGNTPAITVSGKEADGITIRGTVSDDETGGAGTFSGIKEIHWTLSGPSETGTLHTDTSPNTWVFTIPKDKIQAGSVSITATDKVGYTSAPVAIVFLRDTEPPTAKITNFDDHTAQTGNITVKGTVSDQGIAGVLPNKTRWKIVKKADGAPTLTNPGGSWTNVDKSTVGTWEITSLNLGQYFAESSGSYTSEYATELAAPSEGLFNLPLYLWVGDASENEAIINLNILVDPAGDKPVVTLIAPLSPLDSAMPLSVGGQITVYGSASVKTGSVGEVYMQVATDASFASDKLVSGWEDKKIDGTENWKTVLNKNNEINNLISGDDGTQIIYYRVRAKNGNGSNKWGGYSAVQKLLFDKGAPVIQDAKFHKDISDLAGTDYKGKEWLTGDDDYLTFSMSDKTGIKEIVTTINGTTTTLAGKAQIEAYQIDGQNVFTAGAAHGSYNDYTAKFPLKTSLLAGAGGEYSITITVTEGTATGTTFLTQTATYIFNFDKEAPGGFIGEYIDAGNSTFTGTTLPSILNDAEVGQYLYVNKKQIPIIAGSALGTKQLKDPVNGTFDWVLYKDRDYFTGSSAAIRGIAYDEGTSGVAQITGYIKDTTQLTGTGFTVEKKTFRKPIGDFITWEATVPIPTDKADGEYTLVYTVEDGNGNKSAELTQKIHIKRKGIHISTVLLGTDLNRSDAVEAGSEEVVTFKESKPQQDDRTFDWSGEIDASSFVFKRIASTTVNNVIGTIAVEYTGGNMPIRYTLKKGNTEIKSDTLPTDKIIPLTQAEFDKIGIGAVELDLEIKDSCGWKSSEKIKTKVDITDNIKPKGGVLPLFWNDTGKNKNSIVWEQDPKDATRFIAQGHIAYEGYSTNSNPADLNSYTKRYAVSGKIIVSGYVHDETLLKEVSVTVKHGTHTTTVSSPFKNDGTDEWTPGTVPTAGLSLNVIKQKLNQTGHYAFWELTWDTSKITDTVGSNIQVSVTAKDSSNEQEAENKIKIIAGTDTTGGTHRGGLSTDLTIAALNNADADMVQAGQTVRLHSSDIDAYYVYIKTKTEVTVSETQKKLTLGLSDSVDSSITNYQIYTNTPDTIDIKSITVDVVPYISGITTALSKLGGNDPDLYARTALGRYPVQDGEKIEVHGFNLAGAACTVGGVNAGTLAPVSGKDNEWTLTLPANATSGKLEAAVGTSAIAAINNINNNAKPYNQGSKTANNNKLTDDVELDIWQFKRAATPANGFISYPVLKISPKDGSVGLAYANGVEYFNMAGFANAAGQTGYKSARKFDQNWAQYVHTDFVFDEYGYTYGMATGVDMNSGDSGGVASYSKFVSRRPGSIAPRNNYGNNDGTKNGIGLRLENIGTTNNPYTADPDRIQSPSITTVAGNAANEETFIYLAYYDTINQHIRYRWGSVSKKASTPFHQYGVQQVGTQEVKGQLIDLTGYGKMQEPPASSFSILAGPPAKKYSTDNGGSTQSGAVNNSGKYVSLAAVKASVHSTTHDVVTAVWYNFKERSLLYAYTTGDPRTDNVTWSAPVKISSGGEYVRSIVDPDGGIHVAFYDSGNLKYAYLPKYDSTSWSVVVVDAYSLTGTHVSIDLARAKAGGKWIPYIGYYMQGGASAKLAYLVDETVPSAAEVNAGMGNGSIKAGAGTDERFTGSWEVSIVPVEHEIREYRINVGVYKDSSGVIQAIKKADTSGSDVAGWVTGGNGTKNPIIGYAVVEDGAFETAQKK